MIAAMEHEQSRPGRSGLHATGRHNCQQGCRASQGPRVRQQRMQTSPEAPTSQGPVHMRGICRRPEGQSTTSSHRGVEMQACGPLALGANRAPPPTTTNTLPLPREGQR